MAAPTPRGTANAAVSPIIQIVPQRAALMPASSGLREGKLLTKSQLTRPMPWDVTSMSSTDERGDRKHVAARHRSAKPMPAPSGPGACAGKSSRLSSFVNLAELV